MDEFKGAKAFLMIPPSISRDKELLKKPKSIILMGEIISMLNVTGDFHMSNKALANILDASVQSVNDWLNLLEQKGLIVREQITVPAKNPKSEKSKIILGRKIKAGPSLVKLSLLGWTSPLDEGSKAELSGVVKPTLHKYNNLIDHGNRTSNSSSGRRREEDPEREQIYKQFFQLARMHDRMKQKATNPTYDEIKQLRSLLYRCNIDTLKAVVSKFDMKMQWNMVSDPFAYLLKMLRDGLAIDKDSESWGK
ncbi:helix-turn-helix domain-containing protein [Lactobacillus crispatus]|uniref:helix-turn-helix domain-containing protein n=1 Tax=Lactobacillus crispatus TaxID=47770 RepID=UPI0003989397|nr:helix-turn-helix domain-containing protein [Lactobacillus crispatus]QYA51780.1 hypothetical protein N580_08250 [Lactobacillus crispatus 2029]